ncbi:hypothetical protein RhiirA4_514775 [Rhizophagus irregularis]|uniref:Uncharacterized protein n=1 Tax=Rhizophagus irregularis TaxID=588596 RepID=A0A2I1HK52_9GLOM|nr:hypothetical protein RhiirA4_514775 [Rhizophagus irregularis]
MTSINPDFITFPIQETTNEDLILVNDSSTNHTFFHNYPSNPHIHAVRVFGGKNYSQSYKIISLGRYPTKVKYTKKEKEVAHKIPDNYQVETMLNGLTVLCKIQYQFSRKVTVKYTIERVDENGQKESRFSWGCKFLISKSDDDIKHLDSIVRACDETLISRDGYRRLAQAIPNLTREHVIEKRRNEITKSMKILVPIKSFNICSAAINNYGDESQQNISEVEFDDEEVGNGAYHSITSLLDIIVPILATSTSPVLKIGNKINIRISGDGRNVGRKQKHVMLTMCILNEGEMVLNPTHQYSICLYIGKESYDSLSTVSAIFSQELEQLKTNGYKASNNTIWPVEFFFSGCKNTMLFQAIDQNNWIPDELHLMLRISDVLFQCLFYELMKHKDFANNVQPMIITEMKRLHIHFEFYLPTTKNGKWEWTSLMGPDKKKILKEFQVAHLFGRQSTRGQEIEQLWHEFYRLYKIICQKSITDLEIDQFEADAKQWIHNFCRPTIGIMNSANQQQGMYLHTDVSPYMHVFAQHVPQFMQYLNQKGIIIYN